MRRSVMPDAVANAPGIRHAVARAVVVQRRSLVWPVTSSARGRSFLTGPGTCRASPAAPLGVPAPPVGCSPCRASTSAAAANPSASLRGGLVRGAAVGRARAHKILEATQRVWLSGFHCDCKTILRLANSGWDG